MNIALWIIQGLLGVAMFGAGTFKIVTPHDQLAAKMPWALTWSPGRVKLLGLAQTAGAVGLIAPWATGIAPVLTPIAACCLLVLMVGAVKTHIDRKEPFIAPAVISVLCALVALGRFGVFGAP
jgi:putative exporter of polyketide antibiotics